jgi:hypothetical protein
MFFLTLSVLLIAQTRLYSHLALTLTGIYRLFYSKPNHEKKGVEKYKARTVETILGHAQIIC